MEERGFSTRKAATYAICSLNLTFVFLGKAQTYTYMFGFREINL